MAKLQTSVVPHPSFSPKLPPAEFFLLSNLESTLRVSPNPRGDSGKCVKFTERYHRKLVPGRFPITEETLGTVYRQ